MANVVKFKINGLSSALNNVYTRVTDLSRNELYSGETLVSDASGNVELDIGIAGSDGQGVIVYGDNYSAGNESTFKSFTGYGLVEAEILESYNLGLKYMPSSDSFINNGSNTPITSAFKIEAETSFTKVRVWVQGRNDSQGWKFSAAPTEAAANDTNDRRFKPIKNGVVDDSLWVANQTLPDLVGGSDTAPAMAHSEWVDIQSLPPSTGSRPFLLCRVYGPATGSYQKSSGNSAWLSGSSIPYYRQWQVNGTSNDVVTDPTLTTGLVNEYSGAWSHWVGFEFQSNVPSSTVYALGDSITSGGGGQLYSYDCWLTRACLAKSTPAAPFSPFNGGMSGKNSTAYHNQFLAFVEAGLRPTHVIIPAFTPNDGTPTQASCDARLVKIQTAIAKCKEIGAKIYLWTGLPVDGYGIDTWRIYANTLAVNLAASDPEITLIDYNAIMGDVANPARFKAGYARSDGIHPSDTGIQVMADTLQALL